MRVTHNKKNAPGSATGSVPTTSSDATKHTPAGTAELFSDLPIAVVTRHIKPGRRTARGVEVRCPFCQRKHWHGTPDGLPTVRLSHCSKRGVEVDTYRIVDGGDVS